MNDNKLVMINDSDNVGVALLDLKQGETIRIGQKPLTLYEDIPFGHKAAITAINKGGCIIKYGMPIGHATFNIKAGAHIHTHNLKTNLSRTIKYQYHRALKTDVPVKKQAQYTFQGYVRTDGKVGIRNEVWIIPTVGCVNQTAWRLERQAKELFGDKVDDIHAYNHNMGCSQLTKDFERTQRILSGIINHPNAGAVLVLSLGCENNNLEQFIPLLGNYSKNRIKFLVTQEVEDEYEEGIKLLKELVDYASTFEREEVPANKLVLGLKCGGSDAFSGITANALVGRVNDKVTRFGGTTILTEVPEMFGAETLLMNRAVNEDTFNLIVNLINNFKKYFIKYNQVIYENPSPGNKKGGISTLEEKSLGCVQKGGTAPVVGVLDYGEQVSSKGLNLLTGPGNDQVSCTNLVASGVQMILFTTGRGNPFGAPVPTVKIASNTKLWGLKRHWIDFNAGDLLHGKSLKRLEDDLLYYLLELASGKVKTQNEIYNYKDISIFRDGVIL